jgi:antitoxin VapB
MLKRHVKLFRNNRSQALRIPREFELPGTEAMVTKDGDRLIVEPMPRQSLLELLDSWKHDPLGPEETFPEIADPPPKPVHL